MLDNLIREIENNSDIEVVSFDIFDTILFRLCKEPKNVFELMYNVETDLFPSFTTANDFVCARKKAEQKAREKAHLHNNKSFEVTLNDIYEFLPPVYDYRKEISELEIRVEKMVIRLNPYIYESLKYIKTCLKKKVVLISDMYLRRDEIIDLLSFSGFDVSLVDDIWISCEYGVSKKEGFLFDLFLKQKSLSATDIIHIGDNWYSDIAVPKSKNINVYYYDFISEAKRRYPSLIMEEIVYGNEEKGVDQLYFLPRILAAEKNTYIGEEHDWFDMGAMIFGPFLTAGVEWTLDNAEQHGIYNIRPLMREGELLCKMLLNAKKKRKTDFSIEPLYISRLAVHLSTLDSISPKEIQYLANSNGVTLGQFAKLLDVEDLLSKLSPLFDILLTELVNVPYENTSVKKYLLEYLSLEENLNIIRKRNSNRRELLANYLKEIGFLKKTITLDIGWRGYTQNAIDEILKDFEGVPQPLHLLLVASPGAVDNACCGSDIRGYIGNFGSDNTHIMNIYTRIMELVFFCQEGTTVGYTMENNKIIPVKKDIQYSEKQKRSMKILQEGILTYQNTFLDMGCNNVSMDNRLLLFRILERLCSFPLPKEAQMWSEIRYDQNLGADNFEDVVDSKLLSERCALEEDCFFSKSRKNGLAWYSGINVLADRNYHLRNIFKYNRSFVNLMLLSMVEYVAKHDDKIVIVGAGNRGDKYLDLLRLYSLDRNVLGYIDNDEIKQGNKKQGIVIYSPQTDFGEVVYVCPMEGKGICDTIKNQIKEALNRKIKFLSVYQDIDEI